MKGVGLVWQEMQNLLLPDAEISFLKIKFGDGKTSALANLRLCITNSPSPKGQNHNVICFTYLKICFLMSTVVYYGQKIQFY